MYKLAVVGGGVTGLWSAFMGGEDSILIEADKELGKNSLSSLWTIIPPLCGDLKEGCITSEKDYEDLCFDLGIFCKKVHILMLNNFSGSGKIIEKSEIKTFEPQLNAERAEFFENGMFVEGSEFFTRMEDILNVEKGVEVTKINLDGNSVKSLETNKGEIIAEKYVFATGYLTQRLINVDVSLYKGHLIKTRRVGLNGILIYKGRIAVEGIDLYLNGDSVKTTDPSVNYDVVNETMSIISEVLPATPANLSVHTGFRTVSNSGKPIVERIFDNAVLITGHRFGFALAPFLTRIGMKTLKMR